MSAPDESTDNDGDGLSVAQESAQGTLDDKQDTDGDGLNDKVESVWNTDRQAEFCKTSVTPYVCTYPSPLTQDIYVQIDWMNDGTTALKPSDTQLGLVSDAFAAKGINFHADTGQYEGGNEFTTYTSSLPFEKTTGTDFFDYKDANLASDRQGIWRYIITGNTYSEDTSSSGATYAGSDDISIAYRHIITDQIGFGYSDSDTAVAGTLIHEIGHSLCLSKAAAYSYQSSDCVYDNIDQGSDSYYDSSMNYDYQMAMVDYSSGANIALHSTQDHDDWSAVGSHMGDFTSWDYDTQHNYGDHGRSSGQVKFIKGINVSTAKYLKSKGLLKTGKVTWRHVKVAKDVKL